MVEKEKKKARIAPNMGTCLKLISQVKIVI